VTSDAGSEGRQGAHGRGLLTPRVIGVLVLAVVIFVWIAVNRDRIDVSFLVGSVEMPLWGALAIAAFLGLAAGVLLGRRHYKS
jgi:uncharacterized integral membrane protein